MQGKCSFPPSPIGRTSYRFVTALGVLLLCAAMPLAHGQGTDLVVNGGFEANPVPPYPGYTGTITGWTLGGGDVLNNASGPFYQPANGPIPQGGMVYGHQGGGAISQTISGLSNGANCTLKFYRNLRVTAPMKLTVLMGSQTLWGPTRILTTNPFVEETVNFTHNSAWGNTLTFSFTEPEGDATILLDHVRLFVSYTVTPSVTGGNGAIAPNTAQPVNAGSSVAFTMTPNSGYRLSQVLIDGVRIDDLSTTYTFTNVYANHTIAASFALPDWTFDTGGYYEGWSPYGHIASSQVTGGLLRYDITAAATDPMWGSQRLTLPRTGYRWLRVIAKNETKCTGSIMFWDDNTIGGFTGGYQHNYPINPHDTQLSEYWVDLNAHALWMAATTIEQFRFDFPDNAPDGPPLGSSGTRVDVDRITLQPNGSGPPPPQVTSIIRYNPLTAPPNYTNAAQVTWEVRFNHTMTTVAANDFGFTATGGASGTVATVTQLGPTWYRVTANVSGTGTLRLNSVTGGSARDVANQAISTGYTTGEIYNIDRQGPAAAIGAPSTTLTKSGPVTYSVTYTDAGSGFSASTIAPANITLNATGTAAGTIGVSGSGATRTVTISGITGTGTLGISIAAGTATDALGNPAPAAGPSATFVVDNTPPTALCKDITVNLSAATIGPDAINNGSSDNVAVASLTINGGASVTYTCANLGNNTATLRVTDTVGNYAECTATVTVVDDIDPVAVCQNVTVNLSAPTLAALAIDGGSSDNCGITTRLIDGAPSKTFTCANLGPNTVTLRVEDAAGNFDTCQATVTVVDNVNPVAACQNITVNLSVPIIPASAIDGGSTDNCGITTYLIDGNPTRTFTCANIPSTTAVLRVQDGAGNFATCTATVHVVDDLAPVAVCQDITVNLTAPTIGAAALDGGSTDNCGITSRLIDGAPNKTFTCADLGPNTVTLLVGDAAGNTNTCQATVTVVDNINPTALCQDISVNLSAPTVAAAAIDGGSTDNCAITTRLIDGLANRTFVCADMPSTVATLTVRDAADNSASCPATVTVVDDIIPVISMNGVSPVTVECGAAYTDAGATANDNCDGALVPAVANTVDTAVLGNYTVTYTASDGAGNAAVPVVRQVNVVDTTAPVITRNGSATVTVECPNLYADAGATAADVCYGDLTPSIVTVNPVDTSVPDTYTITYDITDVEGNVATQVTRTVTVQDTTLPVITMLGDATVTVECGAGYTDAGATADDSCAGDLTSGIIAVSTVLPNTVGAYTVTYTVSDGNGNDAVPAVRTVNVVDTIAPVAACKDATVYLSAPTLAPGDIDNGSSDNCGIGSMLVNGAASITYGAGDVGVQSVTLRVEDAGGLFAECTAQVTVVDDTPIEGEGEPPAEGEGEPPVEGEGEPPVEGEGEPPVEGEDEGLIVTADPTYFDVPVGATVTFEVMVSGAQGALSYQWYRTTPDDEYVIIPDATDGVYTLTDITLENAGEYQCAVYDSVLAEEAWSPVFTLVVGTDVPVATALGLVLISAVTALAGVTVLRKRR